jgi:hypothetical protein
MRWTASQALAQIICGKPFKLEAGEWKPGMGPAIPDAQKRLARCIAQGQVQAMGRRRCHAALEMVPADIFRITDIEVVISPHGDIVSLRPHQVYRGEQWCSVGFDAAEITRAFPSAPKQSVDQWMLQEGNRYRSAGRTGKRDIMVKDCQTATGCSNREAIAARKRLPEHLRRQRGKPRKHPV